MRKALMLTTALTLGTLSPGFAGGPVEVVVEPAVVKAEPTTSNGLLIPLLLLGVIIATVVLDEDEPAAAISDIRLKEDVVRVGTNHLGLGVYRYRYKGMDGVWEGVMAQEVEILHPGAVRALPLGYKAVNYRKLGLELKRVA